MFKRLYAAFVRPRLEYAQSVWAPHTQKLINLLENVQIRATRLVNGLGDVEYKERLRRLNFPTLAYRRRRCDMIEIYKHFNSCDQNVIPTSFQPKESVSRKHKFQLYYKRPRDGVRGIQHNSFYFRTSKLWNNLPSKVVHADTKNTFKNRLDIFWKDEPIYVGSHCFDIYERFIDDNISSCESVFINNNNNNNNYLFIYLFIHLFIYSFINRLILSK